MQRNQSCSPSTGDAINEVFALMREQGLDDKMDDEQLADWMAAELTARGVTVVE